MPDPLFMIDDAAAPGLGEDTRHTPVPGKLSSRRVEGFVGDPSRYVIKGLTRPKSWVITGPLLADTFADLYAHIDTYAAMQQDITPHKLTIHGVPFEDADLASFRLRGRPHAYQAEGMVAPGARVEVYMLWELLV
ncbi:MAG: hypothetical protein AAGA29_05925 [Planctomycetota bacterium]